MNRFRPLLLTLLLVFSQVALALHQADHIANDSQTECQLCLHIPAGHPHPPQILITPTFAALPATAPDASKTDACSPATHAWLARAPPKLR